MVRYTKEQVIKAFEDMRNAWFVINDSYNDIDDAYGVNDWFNDACGTVDADTGEKIGTLYQYCFSGSFDEIPMIEFCRAMEDYLKGLGSSKSESKLKIKVHERSRSEDCGSSASSLGAAPTGSRRNMDDESVHRTRHYGR